MARKSTGGVVESQTARGTVYALRFRAHGKRHYVTLGGSWEGWNRSRADEALADRMVELRLGIWRPAEPPREVETMPAPEPSFHEFASQWFEAKKLELRPNTVAAYEWEISYLLLPYFARYRLGEITVELVDKYRTTMVRQSKAHAPAWAAWREQCAATPTGQRKPPRPAKPLSNESINKSLTRLAQILELAVEYGYLERNPAAGRRRRLKVDRPAGSYLNRAEQIEALLAAAAEIDRAENRSRHFNRHAMVATLVFAGLRLSELLALTWRDVDLAAGQIKVRESKTSAGVRHVELLPMLREVLSAWKAKRAPESRDEFVFPTGNATEISQGNFRRMLDRAVAIAEAELERNGGSQLPRRLTPHSLRRTFASVLFALGERPVPFVMDQLGHTDPKLTLTIYAKAMRRDAGEAERLRGLVGLDDWSAVMGSDTAQIGPNRPESAVIPSSRDGLFSQQ
jgi:integrase